jgi:hypothetical protein
MWMLQPEGRGKRESKDILLLSKGVVLKLHVSLLLTFYWTKLRCTAIQTCKGFWEIQSLCIAVMFLNKNSITSEEGETGVVHNCLSYLDV